MKHSPFDAYIPDHNQPMMNGERLPACRDDALYTATGSVNNCDGSGWLIRLRRFGKADVILRERWRPRLERKMNMMASQGNEGVGTCC
jgi:hypothetical protein